MAIKMSEVMFGGSPVVLEAGKLLCEDFEKKGISLQPFKESMRMKEDINTGNASALYITALSSVIRAAVEPNMIAKELLQLNTDLMNGGGKGAIKLPKEKRVTAATLGEGGNVVYTGEGYESITVSPTKKAAASKITWEMVKRGMISMITAEAARVGKAIARKVDSDILSGIEAITIAGNSNRVVTGGATTRISYAKLIDTIATVEAYDVGGFKVTHIIVHPNDYAALMKDTDFKEALKYSPVVSGSGESHSVGIMPMIEYFRGIKVISTAQVTDGKTLCVDANELGTFVQESDLEVCDGRIPGSVDTEIIALMSYGMGIQNTRAAAVCEKAAS